MPFPVRRFHRTLHHPGSRDHLHKSFDFSFANEQCHLPIENLMNHQSFYLVFLQNLADCGEAQFQVGDDVIDGFKSN
jgi:hypothetical protein